jgi:hypothetical protein
MEGAYLRQAARKTMKVLNLHLPPKKEEKGEAVPAFPTVPPSRFTAGQTLDALIAVKPQTQAYAAEDGRLPDPTLRQKTQAHGAGRPGSAAALLRAVIAATPVRDDDLLWHLLSRPELKHLADSGDAQAQRALDARRFARWSQLPVAMRRALMDAGGDPAALDDDDDLMPGA